MIRLGPLSKEQQLTSKLNALLKSSTGSNSEIQIWHSPLALAIYRTLQERNLLDFDCIIPIPLASCC
jgi:hypothetical protein